MQNNLSKNNKTIFEQIKRLEEDGNEWWSARELGKILEYSEYRHFKPVIEKAKEACRNSGQEKYVMLLLIPSNSRELNMMNSTPLNTPTMSDKLSTNNQTIFEQIKELDDNGNEFWGARKLSKILEYSEYRHFLPVVERAKEACINSGQKISDHFEDYLEEISHGKGAKQDYPSVKFSRYACYLIVQNADPSKEVVALGQTYFAVQTRLQEIRQMDEYNP